MNNVFYSKLPYVIMSIFAGALTDRFDKKKTMLVCDVLDSGISDPEPGESVSQGGAPIFAEDAVGVSHITAEQFDKGRLLFPGK